MSTFEWKWCRIHDAPLIFKEAGWACYWSHYLPPSPSDVTLVKVQHESSPLTQSGEGNGKTETT